MMMLNRSSSFGLSAAALFLGLLATPAFAQPAPELRPADRAGMEQCLKSAVERDAGPEECIGFVAVPCGEAAQETTVAIIECLTREHAFWDRLLNQAYGDIRASGDDAGKARLRGVQRRWIDWRKANCDWKASIFEGGSLAGVVADQCWNEETARRAIDLVGALVEGTDGFRLREADLGWRAS